MNEACVERRSACVGHHWRKWNQWHWTWNIQTSRPWHLPTSNERLWLEDALSRRDMLLNVLLPQFPTGGSGRRRNQISCKQRVLIYDASRRVSGKEISGPTHLALRRNVTTLDVITPWSGSQSDGNRTFRQASIRWPPNKYTYQGQI